VGRQVHRMYPGQATAPPANGSADRTDDVCLRHVALRRFGGSAGRVCPGLV
jgi:hypothetical protein